MRATRILSAALWLAACAVWAQSGNEPGPDGWVSLFNGQDLTGWTPMNDATWTVEDGILKYTGVGNGWLRSNETYGDFHLIAEWRYPVAEGDHDAGLFFRAATEGVPWPGSTYQMNMGPGDNLGSVTGIPNAEKRPDLVKQPGGEWNSYELIVVGDKALALINGQKAWDAYGFTLPEGYIGWQGEGIPLEVRSVRIRRLTPSARE